MTEERIQQAWPDPAQKLLLGDVEIDLRYRVVRREGVPHELNARTFELLLLFLREPRILHTRDAIFDRLWPGGVVEDATLSTCIWMLRRALGNEAKLWIRTVPKKGYVFDPPASVRLTVCQLDEPTVDASPTSASESVASPRSSVSDSKIASVSSSPRARKWPMLAAAGVVLAILLSGLALLTKGSQIEPNRVALIVSPNHEVAGEARWQSSLLQAWLSWQLSGLPNTVQVDASNMCSGCRETVVLVGAEMPAHSNGDWTVFARFRGDQQHADIVRHCAEEHLIEMIDQVSKDVLHVLEPSTDLKAFPLLEIGSNLAHRLVDGVEEERRHHWGKAAQIYTEVSEKESGFGFILLRLAETLAKLGQREGANRAYNQAERWLAALPPELQQPVRAHEAFIRQDYEAAAMAYAALRNSGDGKQMIYRVAEAESLRRAGRTRDAAERLGNDVPTTDADSAVNWLIERGFIYLLNQNLDEAATSAKDAMERTHLLGWDHEHAEAAALLTIVQSSRGEPASDETIEQIAREFENTGDHPRALLLRFYSELDTATPGSELHTLDKLLSESRLAGNYEVEVKALRNAAIFYEGSGNLDRARDLYSQALTVVETSRNGFEALMLHSNLLSADILRLNFPALDERLALLRTKKLQGLPEYDAERTAGELAALRGDYDAAIHALARAEDALRKANPQNASRLSSSLYCGRGDIHLAQGRLADAGEDVRDCRAGKTAASDQFADIFDAKLAIYTGDPAKARPLLQPLLKELPKQPFVLNRWIFTINVTALEARVGDLDGARRTLDEIMPALKQSGARQIEVGAHATLAEIALAQGRVDDAASEVEQGLMLSPADYWTDIPRLRIVQVLIARARGHTEEASSTLLSLHDDAKKRGDVVVELLTHSLGTIKTCPDSRRDELISQSGLRGVTARWMISQFHGTPH